MALSSRFLKSAAVAASVAAAALTFSDPAFARGGWGGGGFHGGGWGGGFHGGGWGGGWRGGGWNGGWGGGGWNGGWGWGGGWGVPVWGGPYYDDYYYGNDYPVVIRRPVVVVQRYHRSCIWRRVLVHTPYGVRWRSVRYCRQ